MFMASTAVLALYESIRADRMKTMRNGSRRSVRPSEARTGRLAPLPAQGPVVAR